MRVFTKKDKQDQPGVQKLRLTDAASMRGKGELARGRILAIESERTFGEMAEPCCNSVLNLEVHADGQRSFAVTIRQRLTRTELEQLTGDNVIAPVWVHRKNPSTVAIDVTAGPIEHAA